MPPGPPVRVIDDEPTPPPVPTATPILSTPTPTPSDSPSPEPSASSTPSISPSATVPPSPSVAPSPPVLPSPPPPPPIPPAPNPAQLIPLPSAPPSIAFRSQPPSAAEIAQVIPQVEVWRAGAVSPQRPARHGPRLETAYVADNTPVLVRLQFDPLATGKTVTITGATRIVANPPQTILPVQVGGDCIISLQLDESAARGHITFSCEGQTTTLPLARALPEVVVAKENPSGERAR
jgi:hypothetical protein